MLYNIVFQNKSLPLQCFKRITNRITLITSRKGRLIKTNEMKTNEKMISLLRYQIERYQSLKNGVMCQLLNAKLNKLLAK